MASNGEDEAWKEHSQRNEDSSSEGVSEFTVGKASLEPNKCREDYQWRRENVTNRYTVDKNSLR